MRRATSVKQIIIGHVVVWAAGVAFMALFIGDAFDRAVLPFVMATPIVISAAIRSHILVCL
jgi:hypothetical protein